MSTKRYFKIFIFTIKFFILGGHMVLFLVALLSENFENAARIQIFRHFHFPINRRPPLAKKPTNSLSHQFSALANSLSLQGLFEKSQKNLCFFAKATLPLPSSSQTPNQDHFHLCKNPYQSSSATASKIQKYQFQSKIAEQAFKSHSWSDFRKKQVYW